MMMMLVSEILFGDIRLHSIGFHRPRRNSAKRTTACRLRTQERVSCGQRLAQRWMSAKFLGTSKKGRG
jgi:hypothetical protein